MAEESLIEGEDENILYDLLVITEWPPETDTQVSQAYIYTRFQLNVKIVCWTCIWRIAWPENQLIGCMGSTAQSHVAETYCCTAS